MHLFKLEASLDEHLIARRYLRMKRLIAVVRARGISQWRNHELSTRLTLHHLDSLLLELGADGLHIAWCYGSLWL